MNTSFIERLNLTTARARPICFGERPPMLARRASSNFVRPHGALKVGREVRTPAMQAGLATRRLTFREVFACQPASLLVVSSTHRRDHVRRAAPVEQKAIREIMVFLQSHGVGTSRAVRIYKTYGADAIPLVSENPYCLARDIKGIGFRTADQIAETLGIEKTAMIRARAGISYTLTEAVSEGHCGLPEDGLLPMAEQLLEIPADILREALRHELQDQTVVADTIGERRCVFLGHLWTAEKVVAERLRARQTR